MHLISLGEKSVLCILVVNIKDNIFWEGVMLGWKLNSHIVPK